MRLHPVALLVAPDLAVGGLEGLLGKFVEGSLLGLARALVVHDDAVVGLKRSSDLLAGFLFLVVLVHVVEEGSEECVTFLFVPCLLEVSFLEGGLHGVELVHVAIESLEPVDLAGVGRGVAVLSVRPGFHFRVEYSLDRLGEVGNLLWDGLLERVVLFLRSNAKLAVPGRSRGGGHGRSKGGGNGRSRGGSGGRVLGLTPWTAGGIAGRGRGFVSIAIGVLLGRHVAGPCLFWGHVVVQHAVLADPVIVHVLLVLAVLLCAS